MFSRDWQFPLTTMIRCSADLMSAARVGTCASVSQRSKIQKQEDT